MNLPEWRVSGPKRLPPLSALPDSAPTTRRFQAAESFRFDIHRSRRASEYLIARSEIRRAASHLQESRLVQTAAVMRYVTFGEVVALHRAIIDMSLDQHIKAVVGCCACAAQIGRRTGRKHGPVVVRWCRGWGSNPHDLTVTGF
jgi:hypothetical protein